MLGILWRARILVIAVLVSVPMFSARAQTSADLAFLNSQVNELIKESKLPEALLLAEKAVQVAEQRYGTTHPELAEPLNNLAEVYRAQGRYAEAEPYYKRCLEISEKTFGTDHRQVGALVNNLALLYRAQGLYTEAELLLKRSIAIYEKDVSAAPRHMAAVLNNLALLYRAQNRYAEAEESFERSIRILDKAVSPDHRDVGTLLNNLALLYTSQGRYAEAEPILKRSIAITEKTVAPDHPDVGGSLRNLALLYVSQRRYDVSQERLSQVEFLFKRSIAISEKALGPDHPTVALTIGFFGAFLKSEGRLDEAEPLLTRALEAAQKTLASNHPQVANATVQLAELYALQGRTTDLQRLFAEANATSIELKELPIYFATNRKRDLRQKRIAFGAERDTGQLTLGVLKVVVPPPPPPPWAGGQDRVKGSGTKTLVGDVRQLAIQPATLFEADQVVRAARERLIGARTYLGQALVFVHGFNTSFDNAIRRAAQLAYDLNFDGPVFMFSWPARESLFSYVGARESAQLAGDPLREFIETVVAETKAKRIHIIAHSMGNVALNDALWALDEATLAKLNIGELVLASPDLDPDLFQRTYKRLQKRGATATIYAASSDWALWLSSGLRDLPQLGYIPSGGPKRLIAGTNLIDITAVNSDIFNLNHDLYANSPAVITDLKRLLKEGQRPPEERTPELVKLPTSGGTYWRYKAPGSGP